MLSDKKKADKHKPDKKKVYVALEKADRKKQKPK